jgi:hypothetical protein
VTDHDRWQDLTYLALVFLIIMPFVTAAWVSLGPGEALVLPVVAMFFFASKWVRINVEVKWKEDNDD